MKLDFWKKEESYQPNYCELCGREMHTGSSCLPMPLSIGGQAVGRITHGNEPEWAEFSTTPRDRCLDCGVLIGGLHHPGCDQEKCPVCKEQLLFCGCEDEEDDDQGDDDPDPEPVGSGGKSWFSFRR